MPSKILTDLAPELIIQVLKSSGSFADLASLSSTSRKLFIIWKTNNGAICEAVLARTLPCYEQVRELLAAQEKAESNEHLVFGLQSVIDRAKWILKEADTAAKALDYFEKGIRELWAGKIFPVAQAVLKLAERIDFIRAYYLAMTLATLKEEPLPSRVLSSWNTLDLKQVRDVMSWLGFHCAGNQQRDLGVWFDYNSSHQNFFGIISGEKWKNVHSSLIYLTFDLQGLTACLDFDMSAPYFLSLARDHYQDQYKSNRGARLADLLPKIRGRTAHYSVAYKLSEE